MSIKTTLSNLMPGNQSTDPAPDSNTGNPEQGAVDDNTKQDAEELTGLDRLSKLLYNPDNKDSNNDISSSPEDEATNPPFNPTELLANPEVMGKMLEAVDFSTSISKDTQQKLADEAPDAIISLVQDVGKAAYTEALKHSSVLMTHLVDDRLKAQSKEFQSAIKTSIDDHDLTQKLPEISNPVVALATKGFQAQIKAQNPSLSAEQIAEETKNYIKILADTFNPPKPTPEEKKAAQETDWLEELGLNQG